MGTEKFNVGDTEGQRVILVTKWPYPEPVLHSMGFYAPRRYNAAENAVFIVSFQSVGQSRYYSWINFHKSYTSHANDPDLNFK